MLHTLRLYFLTLGCMDEPVYQRQGVPTLAYNQQALTKCCSEAIDAAVDVEVGGSADRRRGKGEL